MSENQKKFFLSSQISGIFWVFFGYFIIWVKLGYFGVFYHCCLGIFQLWSLLSRSMNGDPVWGFWSEWWFLWFPCVIPVYDSPVCDSCVWFLCAILACDSPVYDSCVWFPCMIPVCDSPVWFMCVIPVCDSIVWFPCMIPVCDSPVCDSPVCDSCVWFPCMIPVCDSRVWFSRVWFSCVIIPIHGWNIFSVDMDDRPGNTRHLDLRHHTRLRTHRNNKRLPHQHQVLTSQFTLM